ncbi:RNA-guided endonuclease TnpB family protein [Micromonospora sp. NPDC047707]|uniref:RNA-guided endonuclease TnpB family protein n=1 Tax=Micromonospora sp. NPDC047707 TaxID=3154498 RepID=UPI003452E5F3
MTSGAINAHCASVRSLGYRRRTARSRSRRTRCAGYRRGDTDWTPAIGYNVIRRPSAWKRLARHHRTYRGPSLTSNTTRRRTRPTSQTLTKRWQRARGRLGRVHARVANLRRDGLHKLTTRLAATYGTIVVEDLNVAGMLRNRRLSRRIADAGFAEIRRQLVYKTQWYGGRLVVADRWYPSSKTCSGCGAVRTKLALSERTFTCTTCGLVADRDVNAARNLAALAAAVAGSGPETLNGRRADCKTPPAGPVAVKRQPGTTSVGKTGTVPPQGRTSDHELTPAS